MRKEYKVEGIDKHNPHNFGGMCSREAVIKRLKERSIDEGVEVIAATEAPVLVMDWERFQVVREILPMRYLDLGEFDKVPLLDTHTRNSVEKVKGSAMDWKVEDNKLIARIYVSKSEPATRTKIEEGHIDSVSIGYMTDPGYTVEVPKGARVAIDGQEYRNDFADGFPLLVRTWWTRNELSLVPIGADENAKFRSEAANSKKLMEKISTLENEIEELKNNNTNIRKLAVETLSWHEARLKIANNS